MTTWRHHLFKFNFVVKSSTDQQDAQPAPNSTIPPDQQPTIVPTSKSMVRSRQSGSWHCQSRWSQSQRCWSCWSQSWGPVNTKVKVNGLITPNSKLKLTSPIMPKLTTTDRGRGVPFWQSWKPEIVTEIIIQIVDKPPQKNMIFKGVYLCTIWVTISSRKKISEW